MRIFARKTRQYEDRIDRLGRQAAVSGTHGGCYRPVVPLHVQAVRRRYGLYRIHIVGRTDTRRMEIACQTRHIGFRNAPSAYRFTVIRSSLWSRPPLIAEQADPDLIDINFGCPVKKIAARGAGSGMMRDPDLMVEMTRRIVQAVRKARHGKDASGVERRVQEHRTDSPAVAGCRHSGADHTRTHARADVPRRGRLDADRQHKEQSGHTYTYNRQRRRRLCPARQGDVRPLRRRRGDDRPRHIRPSVDIPRVPPLSRNGRAAAATRRGRARRHSQGASGQIDRGQGRAHRHPRNAAPPVELFQGAARLQARHA